jgi:hypothetical protein
LRDDPRLAPAHLDAGLTLAARSRLQPFVAPAPCAPTATASSPHIRLGLSKIPPYQPLPLRLHSAAPLIALIYHCCAGVLIDLSR